MSHFTRRSLVFALSGMSLVSLLGLSSYADDLFSQAVTQFREKDYKESFTIAKKSSESPQRSFLLGVNALRLGNYEEAVALLSEAETRLPLVGDYAALYQAEALLKLRKFGLAATKAGAISKAYPASTLIRKAEKLYVDSIIASGDYKLALTACDNFIEKYPSGSDSVEVLFLSARCREELGNKLGAAQIYRGIWLDNPRTQQSQNSQERLKELEQAGIKTAPYTAEELVRRASSLFSQNDFSSSLQALQSIPLEGLPDGMISRINLRIGITQYRLRRYKNAQETLTKAATSVVPAIRSEARFWNAKAIERQDQQESAFALYMELVAEGKKQEFAADALVEAAGLLRGQGKYGEAARLFEQVISGFPESRFMTRSAWDAAWCHYLAGENTLAAESFKRLLKNEGVREKALYWLARTLEKGGNADAVEYYRALQDEFPAGFYATWYREQKGIKDCREQIAQGKRPVVPVLPAAFDKPRLLASLGMVDEARREMTAARKKIGYKKALVPALAQFYREIGDFGAVISLFQQNVQPKWEKDSLPLWSAGYPLAFNDFVSQHTAANTLSESLIYALIRAESCFSPTVKSPVGAVGLMQLMPATAKGVAQEKGTFDPARLTTPEYNIKLGTKHFRDLLKGYDGDVVYSVAAYNAGSSAVARWKKNLKGLQKDEFIESIPYQETRDYVKKVYASAATYRQLYGLK
ncbi:transglycosylase SLT domain-containing protein [Pelotalea chapellei]|uniref:Transglycosylase SLT domain-containing protein n=1 Tax=Pelotalea chapellei TaxID=44671 RepID=A0ABS5U664_9BACT|nr:transglycosylase SLT domain-containing protein [Pelotalea chapellei]MBT1071158.1 transglycosylase SLT domain-containing protein [Pelotalea chapellei]